MTLDCEFDHNARPGSECHGTATATITPACTGEEFAACSGALSHTGMYSVLGQTCTCGRPISDCWQITEGVSS